MCSDDTSVTSSSPIKLSPPTSTGEAMGPFHTVLESVAGVAPEGVVVAVGDGDVTEGVDPGRQILGRHGVGLGDPDTQPQAGDALVGDGAFAHWLGALEAVWRPVATIL